MHKIFLKKHKERSLQRFHPWIFSGAIGHVESGTENGDWVEVHSSDKRFLCTGHYQSKTSIAIRILSFERVEDEAVFWRGKLQNALSLRQNAGLLDEPKTNAFRLVFAEGDGLSGLIVDVYGSTAVIQCYTAGMMRALPQITTALQQLEGLTIRSIFDKSADTYSGKKTEGNQYLLGNQAETIIRENGHQFEIDWEEGQKTGFFLDQRENRALLQRYAAGKTVLNAFSYTGGFSIYALKGRAKKVVSVDVSEKAVELAERNAKLNEVTERHEAHKADVFQFLKIQDGRFDIVVLDPPAFAKSLRARHNAVIGYKRLNAMGLQLVAKGGLLFTFSCSQVVDRQLFHDTIRAAAIEAGRKVRVIHQLAQPADHPINIFHPEGEYLKGLVLEVE